MVWLKKENNGASLYLVQPSRVWRTHDKPYGIDHIMQINNLVSRAFPLKKWVAREKALASADHGSLRPPWNPGCNKLAQCEKLKLSVTSQRTILGGLLYLLTINEKFYKISFLSQILAMVIFCFPPISMKGTASGNICKTSFIERYKWQTSYRTCIKFVLEKFVFATLLIFYFISCEVDRRTQPSSIHLNSQPYHHSDTRWFRLILYDLYF